MKAIFIDIDGVLNSARSCLTRLGATITEESSRPFVTVLMDMKETVPYVISESIATVDVQCVAVLNKIIAHVGEDLELVLCSSHRSCLQASGYGSSEHLNHLSAYLTYLGINVPARFSITKQLHAARGMEVKAWLDDREDITDYVILDDGLDFHSDQAHVHVDPNHGLDFACYVEACRFLNVHVSSLIL